MSKLRVLIAAAALSLLGAASASAHFIFIVTEPAEKPSTAKVYFGEQAIPDDPDLLRMIEKAEIWTAAGERGEAKAIEVKVNEDAAALVGEIPSKSAERPIIGKHSFGVTAHGEKAKPYLLQYYAKTYPSQLPGSWRPVGDAERLPLEVTPSLSGNKLTLSVTWKGEAASGCQVTIEGGNLNKPVQGDADSKGQFVVEIPEAGLYSIRARNIEEASGEHNGKKFEEIRHYSTLALRVSPQSVSPVSHQLPDLPKGMTSFGAAVVGDELYVYGGNYGGGHDYSEEAQSGDLHRLNLKSPESGWQTVSTGEKLTGLAAVAHGGKFYRVGGFTVTEKEGGDHELNSRDSFARFDPQTGTWEQLPPLPQPRSSHDVVRIGDTLYVVGGWSMKAADGNNDDGWLNSIATIDLSATPLEWKTIGDVPFQRRALSAAAHKGKLYVIGGMQKKGGPTTRVSIFDPKTGEWTDGPSILGGSMDGFGSASFESAGRLYTTTMSGAIQRLNEEGTAWEAVGQLESPRFFHEISPWNGGLIVVGGASMMTGKALNLEFIPTETTAAVNVGATQSTGARE
jgi:Uncharacterized protein conserved in bacteria